MGILYIGSDVFGFVFVMDKVCCKYLFKVMGLSIVLYIVVDSCNEFDS